MIGLIFLFVALLGWAIVISAVLSLTGLQKKIFEAAGNKNGGLIVTKKVKIPFIGIAEVESTAGEEIILKLKRRRN